MGWGLSEVDFRGAVVWLGVCQPATERRKMKNTKKKSTAVALVIPGAENVQTMSVNKSRGRKQLGQRVITACDVEGKQQPADD